MYKQPKPARVLDPHYRAFVRQQGCIVRGRGDACWGQLECHHVIFPGCGILSSKVSDYETVGLCTRHHEAARRRDWFEEHFGVSFRGEIEELFKRYFSQ